MAMKDYANTRFSGLNQINAQNLGVTDADARDVAAYLYTLR
jgi:hypothetical protein